ncbi:phage major capsid protein [Kribbella sp. NPDC059898]|uniref:phage major capsid protein n=1 Tax=Kribbella sp. NPDC059898 TaxID=3346995 RepID=UPI0036605091
MATIADQLRERRVDLIKQAQEIAQKGVVHNRDLSLNEQTEFDSLYAEAEQVAERIKAISDGEKRGRELNDSFRSVTGRDLSGVLSADDRDLAAAFRSAILAKNPAPIEIAPTRSGQWQPGMEFRDLLKTTPTQALPTSTYDRIVMHLLEGSAVMRAGATVINTATGEDLVVPKSTAFSTSLITNEAATITESDPTLATVTLKAYKYATFFQVSTELAADGNTDLMSFLARQAGESLAQAYGAHLMTGTGTGQPRGALTDAPAGVTGPTGTATSFGTQATGGQGTDLLNSLVGSLAEPYTQSPSTAFLLRNATRTAIANLKTTQGELVGNEYISGSPYPFYVDPFVSAMGANAESVAFGDWSRYFVRIAGGLRFERSNEFAFQNDLVSFRAIIRLDGALVDLNAIKTFTHSAT